MVRQLDLFSAPSAGFDAGLVSRRRTELSARYREDFVRVTAALYHVPPRVAAARSVTGSARRRI
ncbi:MAG TPA: hypothetical protein VGC42_25190 [Kofleriaceae bacterium]